MSDFERIYQTHPSTECDSAREMHPSIELSDEALLERMGASRTGWFVRAGTSIIITEPINGKLEVLKDEKDKSKVVKRKARKDDTKSNKAAVARVQKKS